MQNTKQPNLSRQNGLFRGALGGIKMRILIAGMLMFTGSWVQAAQKPNIILLFIDDLGYGDTGPFGCADIPTPNIDRLAEGGVVLTQTYVTNPPCCPSRSSLLMGMYGQRFGKYGMARGQALPEELPTFAEIFRDHGYVTGQVGKWDVGDKWQGPSARGFMEVAKIAPRTNDDKLNFLCKTEAGDVAWVTEIDGDNLVDFVDRNRKAGKPFLMYWSPLAVHSPHKTIPEEYPARTTAPANRQKLGGGIVCLDDQVGKLLDYLDEHDMRENTLIIFSSDNGPNTGEGGSSTPYRGGKGKDTQQIGWTLSPTIASWLGVIPERSTFDGLACTLDFYATILAAANLPVPAHIDGVDLMPYLTGKKKGDVHEYIYWLNNDPTDTKHRHLVAVRWKNWRLYRHEETDAWQLFDLKKDPREEMDVASKYPEIVQQLGEKHADWKSTLAPCWKISTSKYRSPGPVTPEGYGWVMTDGKAVPRK
jgi:arylsulfatase A-like enzyme